MHRPTGSGNPSMLCTEAYREHIMYTFNGYCKTVIRFAPNYMDSCVVIMVLGRKEGDSK